MKAAKKIPAVIAVAAVFATFLFSFVVLGGDMPKRLTPVAPSWKAGEATMEQLHTFFPHGMFWNHVVGDPNEAYSVTDTACSPYLDDEDLHDKEAGVTCNYFEIPGKVWGGWQCCGYARLLTHNYYGSSFENWETATTLENVKEGDVLYLWNYGPHYVWILSLKANNDGTVSITYADCNGTGKRSHCQIQWDALGALDLKNNVMKNPLLGDWELVTLYKSPPKAAPTTTTIRTTTTTQSHLTVQYNVNGGEAGSKQYTVSDSGDLLVWETGERQVDTFFAQDIADVALLSPEQAGLVRQGYQFVGWSTDKHSDEAATWLSEVYPVSKEQTAVWFSERFYELTRSQLKTAFQNGTRQVTLYAVWIPEDEEITE